MERKKNRRKEKRIRCEYLRWDEVRVKSQVVWCQSASSDVRSSHRGSITQFLIDVTHREEPTVHSASRKHSDARVLCSRLDHGTWQQADTRLVVLASRVRSLFVGMWERCECRRILWDVLAHAA
jgi:hypothetical protein